MNIKDLPTPTAIENISYEEILAQNVELLEKLDPTWRATESDIYMTLLESVSYKEYHLRVSINEKIKKMLPHLSSGADLDNFIFGFYGGVQRVEDETDEEFLDRALLSVNRFSSAGSIGAYEYHTYRADSRIDDVRVVTLSAGVVGVYIASEQIIDDDLVEKVKTALNDEKVRPITDVVKVIPAHIVDVKIEADVELFDVARADEILTTIKERFNRFLKIGEDVIYSQVLSSLMADGVYSVDTNIKKDVVIDEFQIAKIDLRVSFKEAVMR